MPETRKWPRAWLKVRDGRGTTKERLPPKPERMVFHGLVIFWHENSHMCALPLLNLKKKRGCSQSSRSLHVITYLSSALLCFADLCTSLQFTTCDICWFLLASVICFKFLFIWFSTCIHWIISVMSRLWLHQLDPQLACLLPEQWCQFLRHWFSRWWMRWRLL